MIAEMGNLIRISAKGDDLLTTFYEDGHFHTVRVAKDSKLKVHESTQLKVLDTDACVAFDREGFVESFDARCFAPKDH